ncbi:UNKNOWN [Stylonychia lemnae]|uniref:Uncharacterized protein n=1 Tax=Stylonychia lemnae TaxID=5949 RepID=A0A078A259_STYLE|nr:UNKNOWN [Stylonychia lemnae]|eukprot:CDW75912.1 UNKNOWN [Stylonychia lemnae]
MQKIYGTKVQQGNPLEDVEREMKQQAYLSGMQNIYGHYNVQAPSIYYDPDSQTIHTFKDIPYLNPMQKLYGPSVQSEQSQAQDFIAKRKGQKQSHKRNADDDESVKPTTPQDKQMKQLNQLKDIYGIEDPFKQPHQQHHKKPHKETSQKPHHHKKDTDPDMKPMTPSEKTKMFSSALNKIYGVKPDQKPYKPVDQETFEKQQSSIKHKAYKKTLEKIYGKKIDKDEKTGKHEVVDWDSEYKPRKDRKNQATSVQSDDEE